MGIIDDWSYIKSAQMFAQTGHFVYNNWGAVILGWQVPLGALGIKLFGFSFTAARLYMLPVTAFGAWLFYLILADFGVSAFNAAFGTLALFLSPFCSAFFSASGQCWRGRPARPLHGLRLRRRRTSSAALRDKLPGSGRWS